LYYIPAPSTMAASFGSRFAISFSSEELSFAPYVRFRGCSVAP
jgi:hypothetical protein